MTKEREDANPETPLTPATIRQQAAYLLSIFGEDDGARWLLRCADRIVELEVIPSGLLMTSAARTARMV